MDALLLAFIAVALVEQGDRLQMLARRSIAQFGCAGPVAAGLLLGAFANALIAAVAGALTHGLVPYRALTLLLALALLSAGAGALVRAKPAAVIAYPRLGAFGGPAFAGFVLGFGGAAQFLVFAIAARAGSVAFTTVGAMLGTLAALVPVIVAGETLAPVLARIRLGTAILCLVAGAIVAIVALRLV